MKIKYIFLLTIFLFSCTKYSIPISISNSQVKLNELPRFFPDINSTWQVDLRNTDISEIDISSRKYDLFHSVFDNYTIWPDRLPEGFNPEYIINNNLSPGLDINELHKKGIDGTGIKIAVIDLPIDFTHKDINIENISIAKDNFIADNAFENYFHGHAVLSILAGKQSGLAPSSDILYIEATGFDNNGITTCINEIEALNYVLKYNRENNYKINIVSISSGANNQRPMYQEYLEKIVELENNGIVVVSPTLQIQSDNYHFYGLDRDPLDDPNDLMSYRPIIWDEWINKIHNFPGLVEEYSKTFKSGIYTRKTLLLPLDPKTYHGYIDEGHYVYSFTGGWSWLPPYIAGLFALSKQVDKEISFENFWNIAYETGFKYQFQANGEILYASIVDPVKMIERIENDV